MPDIFNSSFSENKYLDESSWQKTAALPKDLHIQQAQTQTDVNSTVLNFLSQKFDLNAPLKTLDLPCGNLEFVSYLKQIFPTSTLTAVDVVKPTLKEGIQFLEMDVSKEFTIPPATKFDLITSISGVMMFSNTKHFIESCIERLKPKGIYIITNDNSATIKDKLAYLFIGSFRIFKPVFADGEHLTENVPVHELCRLLRINNMVVKDIVYTSAYAKDYIFWPIAALVYPLHRLYLSKIRGALPDTLINKMYPFKHLFCRHYIIIAEKQ